MVKWLVKNLPKKKLKSGGFASFSSQAWNEEVSVSGAIFRDHVAASEAVRGHFSMWCSTTRRGLASLSPPAELQFQYKYDLKGIQKGLKVLGCLIMEHSLKTVHFCHKSDRHLHVRSGIMQRRMAARVSVKMDKPIRGGFGGGESTSQWENGASNAK